MRNEHKFKQQDLTIKVCTVHTAKSRGTEGLPEHFEGLSADHRLFVSDKERRHAGYDPNSRFLLCRFERGEVLPDLQGLFHCPGIETRFMSDHCEDVDISNVQAAGKIRCEQGGMKRIEQTLLASEFSGLKGQAGIGQKGPVNEGDPERRAHAPKVLHHAFDVLRTEALCHGGPLRGRFRMDLHAPPFDLKIELLLQFFDEAFADVAEGSDIVGKDLNECGHESDLVFSATEALAK